MAIDWFDIEDVVGKPKPGIAQMGTSSNVGLSNMTPFGISDPDATGTGGDDFASIMAELVAGFNTQLAGMQSSFQAETTRLRSESEARVSKLKQEQIMEDKRRERERVFRAKRTGISGARRGGASASTPSSTLLTGPSTLGGGAGKILLGL